MTRASGPIGYFVHHQGRGHAERAAALAAELAQHRKVTLFSARTDIFPELVSNIKLIEIPSLFEPADTPLTNLDSHPTPDTVHCAPLGWDSVTTAIARLTEWFAHACPALFITDVSAELGQLARIASVPHMAVLQHGDRSDPAHMSSYRSAAGLLAPYAAKLEQPGRPRWMRDKTVYAPGVGIDRSAIIGKAAARKRLGLALDADMVVVVGGGGGTGLPSAPLTLGARDDPASRWVTLGRMQTEWHETPPGNLTHLGWVDNAADWISAADRIVSSCGNTTVHQIASAGKPWIVVPEWRYFAEQIHKAAALDHAGAAAVSRHWPASVQDWRRLWDAALAIDPANQTDLIDPDAAKSAAREITALIEHIWTQAPVSIRDAPATAAIAEGNAP